MKYLRLPFVSHQGVNYFVKCNFAVELELVEEFVFNEPNTVS